MRRSVARRRTARQLSDDSSDEQSSASSDRQLPATATGKGKALQLIKLSGMEDEEDPLRLTLDWRVLDEVMATCEDRPLCIISVVGSTRSGRSFFLNLLKSCLEAMEKGGTNWLKSGSGDVEGFSWKHGIQADTEGIWIWSRAFLVDGEDGEVAVVLLDTQGIDDDKTSLDELNAIVGLSTMISSVVVLNLNGDIPTEVFSEWLLPFLRFGDAAYKKGVDHPPPFQKLSFLVRDWNEPGEHPFGTRGGGDLFQSRLMEQHRKIRDPLKKCFEQVESFLAPHIGGKALTQAFTGNIDDMSEEFVSKMRFYLKSLSKEENLLTKKFLGSTVTAAEFPSFLQAYISLFNELNEKEEDITSETLLQTTLGVTKSLAVGKAMEAYQESFKKMCVNHAMYRQDDSLRVIHTQGKRKATQFFRKSRVPEVFKDEFEKMLENEMEKHFSERMIKNGAARDTLIAESLDKATSLFRAELGRQLPHDPENLKFHENDHINQVERTARKSAADELEISFGVEDEEELDKLKIALDKSLDSIVARVRSGNEACRRNAEGIMDKHLEKLVKDYKSKVTRKIERRQNIDVHSLQDFHEDTLDTILEKFEEMRKPGTEEFIQEYKEKLEDILEKELENYSFAIQAKLDEKMAITEQFIKSNEESYELKLKEKIEVEEMDEEELQLFHQRSLQEILRTFEGVNPFPLTSSQTMQVTQRLRNHLQDIYNQLVEGGVVAKRKLEEDLGKAAEQSLHEYTKEMRRYLDSKKTEILKQEELETKHVEIQDDILLQFDRMSVTVKDKSGVATQQCRSSLQTKLEEAYCQTLQENQESATQHLAEAEGLVNASVQMYQDSINKSTNASTTHVGLKRLHEKSLMEARNHFKSGCLIETESFVEAHLAKIEKEIAETFKEMEEAFSMTKREEDFEVKVRTEEARKYYHEEMTKNVKSGDDQIFMEPDKLHALHKRISKAAVDRVVVKNPGLNENQKAALSLALEKSFIKYKDDNDMLLNYEKDVEPAIGIDLGTTYCCTAVFYKNKVQIIRNKEGGNTTPSYVAFQDDGTTTVGQVAKNEAYRNPEGTIFDAKRIIGRKMNDKELRKDMTFWPFTVVEDKNVPVVKIKDETYPPEQISAILLKQLKEEAQEMLGIPKISKAVITVPAYFNDGQRQATVDAGRIAGLKVLTILNEPTAAAIAYKQNRFQEDAKRVLIFDLGGGTFDVAVLHMDGSDIRVLGVEGDTHLGGEDFDQHMMEHCAKEFRTKTGVDLFQGKDSSTKTEKDSCRQRLRRLQTECEKAKQALSRSKYFDLSIAKMVGDHDLTVRVTRSQFEAMNEDLFRKAIAIVEKALKNVKLGKDDIDDIVLIGGSTRIPKVQEMLEEHFEGRALNKTINPDEAVAQGAAIQAAILNGIKAKKKFNFDSFQDVTPMPLGIEIASMALDVIIEKNTPIPTEHHEVYSTHRNNQVRAGIKIYQGENIAVAANNTLLGEFSLEGIPPGPAGKEKIDVRMFIDTMGILHVTAKSMSTNATQSLTVQEKKDRLSEDTIKRLAEGIQSSTSSGSSS